MQSHCLAATIFEAADDHGVEPAALTRLRQFRGAFLLFCQGCGGEFLGKAFLLGVEMIPPGGVGFHGQFELFARGQRFIGMGMQRLDQELKADVFGEIAFLAFAALLEVVPGVATSGADFAFDSRAQRIELDVASAIGDGFRAEQGVFETAVPETAAEIVADIVAFGELSLQKQGAGPY